MSVPMDQEKEDGENYDEEHHEGTHCPPQTILGKQGALQNFFWEILGMNF